MTCDEFDVCDLWRVACDFYVEEIQETYCLQSGHFERFKTRLTHTSHLTPHTSHLTPHTSHLTPHTSHATPHTSHLTPHTSHATPHTSHHTPHTSHLTHHTCPQSATALAPPPPKSPLSPMRTSFPFGLQRGYIVVNLSPMCRCTRLGWRRLMPGRWG